MGIESSYTFITSLNASWPLGTDTKATIDDHLRGIKTVLTGSFGAIAGAVTSTHTQLNYLASATGTTGTTTTNLVFSTSPTLVTPVLGVATATSINKVAITAPATSATLTIADGKTATISNTLTFTGTDSSSVAFGAGGTVAYTGNKLSVFAATTSAELAGVISDETGSGSLVFSASPTFTGTVSMAALSASGNATVGGTIDVTGKVGARWVRATGGIDTNETGIALSYEGSGESLVGAWGADNSTRGILKFYQAAANGSLGREMARFDVDGIFNFGTHSAIGSETVSGYITVKDSSGNTRKLAVVS